MEKIDMIKKAIYYQRLSNITGRLYLIIMAIAVLLGILLPIYTEWYFFIFPLLAAVPILKVNSDAYRKMRDKFEEMRDHYESCYGECLGETLEELKLQKTLEEIEQKWEEEIIPDRVDVYEPQFDSYVDPNVVEMELVNSYVPEKAKSLVKTKKKWFHD